MTSKQRPSRLGGILRVLLLSILGMLLGAGLFLANAQGLGGNPLPMPFGTGLAVVLSGSMEPALHVDDLVIVREAEAYAVGDVVVWQSGMSLTVHRVVETGADTLTTRGDANNLSDAPVPLGAVRGKVIYSVPGLGAAVRAIRTPAGIIALLTAAILLMELSFRREKAADDAQLEQIKDEIRRLRALQDGKEET